MKHSEMKIQAVNMHLTKKCNMKCKFCFAHFNEVECRMSQVEIEKLMIILRNNGIDKINFVGGEPLIIPNLTRLLKLSSQLGFYTSIVTNGSLINEEFIKEIYPFVNQIGLSIDSLHSITNKLIGRETRGLIANIDFYREITKIISSYNIDLKINTVVSQLNKNELLADFINEVAPIRWKVLQVLKVVGENDKRINDLLLSSKEFNSFCDSNKKRLINPSLLIYEPNSILSGSYLMINPEGKFFDNSKGKYTVSERILKIGVDNALRQIHFDNEKFRIRNGSYYQNNLKVAL
jgi:radical S-adenosyl methionine domain-containing protein 2